MAARQADARLEPDNIIRGLRSLLAIGYHLSIPVTPEEFAQAERRDEWCREKNMIDIDALRKLDPYR